MFNTIQGDTAELSWQHLNSHTMVKSSSMAPDKSNLIFYISKLLCAGYAEESFCAKNLLNLFRYFNTVMSATDTGL